jgi:hypothetical protein
MEVEFGDIVVEFGDIVVEFSFAKNATLPSRNLSICRLARGLLNGSQMIM